MGLDHQAAGRRLAVALPGSGRQTAGRRAVPNIVVTRLNARYLTDRTGRHVRNGDTWQIVRASPWGDLYLTPVEDGSPAGGQPATDARRYQFSFWSKRPDLVVLPVEYVAEHVHLGYAATVHRAQGATSDTCHVITGPGMGREHLYVAMTRGRDANHVYVPTDAAGTDAEPHLAGPSTPTTGRAVLERILATSSAELSATEHRDTLAQARGEPEWLSPSLDVPLLPGPHPDGPALGI